MPTEPPVDIVDHTVVELPAAAHAERDLELRARRVRHAHAQHLHPRRASVDADRAVDGLGLDLEVLDAHLGRVDRRVAALPVETIFAPSSGPMMSTGLAAVIVQAPVYGPAPSMITSLPALVGGGGEGGVDRRLRNAFARDADAVRGRRAGGGSHQQHREQRCEQESGEHAGDLAGRATGPPREVPLALSPKNQGCGYPACWSVDVLGSPSTAAARRGTSSFISVGMLSTDGNEVAS